MSLMNDVLQQLDLRHPQNAPGFKASPATPPIIHGLPLSKIILIALFLMAGYGLGQYWPGVGNIGLATKITTPTVLQSTRPLLADFNKNPWEPAFIPKPVMLPAQPITSVNVSEINPVAVTPAPEQEIDIILADANRLLTADKLMQPLGNNAFTRFREVLLMDTGNQQALAGIEAIKSRYKTLFANALLTDNIDKAKNYLERMSVAGVAAEELTLMAEELQKHLTITVAVAPEVASDQVVETHIDDGLPIEIASASNIKTDHAPVLLNTLGNIEQEDKQLAKQAFAGKLASAKNVLRDFIANHEQAPETEFALAMILAEEKNSQELNSILAQSHQLSATRKLFVQAKQAVTQGDYPHAIALLKSVTPEPAYGVEYKRLLAVAWQNTRQYSLAGEQYQLLLKQQPQNANFWLGLGVCEDAQGHTAEALSAFNRSYALGGHTVGVVQYLRDRIHALSN